MFQVRAIVVYDTLLQEVEKEKYNFSLARKSVLDSDCGKNVSVW